VVALYVFEISRQPNYAAATHFGDDHRHQSDRSGTAAVTVAVVDTTRHQPTGENGGGGDFHRDQPDRRGDDSRLGTSVIMVNATAIGDDRQERRNREGLARTLGGAKAANTRFTYVTLAPTVTITATRAKPATATTVGATASLATAARITL
jgi:hypothetical protein